MSLIDYYNKDTKINEPTLRFNRDEEFDNHIKAIKNINNDTDNDKIEISSDKIQKIKINENYTIEDTIISPINKNELIQSIEYINNYVKEDNTAKLLTNINMDEKIHIYTILHILIKTFYNGNDIVNKIYEKIITESATRCAPRSVFDTLAQQGGYNNKSGDIEYQICKCNFKQNIKKVSAKSAREAAKIVANKVLKGDKKSITFSLKRIIGKKEKCYDYNASIDKSGKILIKSQ
jgi:hypothetical protein